MKDNDLVTVIKGSGATKKFSIPTEKEFNQMQNNKPFKLDPEKIKKAKKDCEYIRSLFA